MTGAIHDHNKSITLEVLHCSQCYGGFLTQRSHTQTQLGEKCVNVRSRMREMNERTFAIA